MGITVLRVRQPQRKKINQISEGPRLWNWDLRLETSEPEPHSCTTVTNWSPPQCWKVLYPSSTLVLG